MSNNALSNPYNRPYIGSGTGATLVPSNYNSPQILWKWNERDTTQFGAAICSTDYDAVYNALNGGTFTTTATYLADGDGSSVGPRVRFTGTGALGSGGRPATNQGGCVIVPILDCPLLPRRFVINYRLCAINPSNVGGWGFALYNSVTPYRAMGYTHNSSTANVIVNRYDPVTPEAAGAYWPWASAANTRALAGVTTLTSATNIAGAVYRSEWCNYFDATGANPPRGYTANTCLSNTNALNTANALVQTAGTTTSYLGVTPGTGFNGFVGTRVGFMCRWPNPGNINQIADFAEIYITTHPMDNY